jgi:DNA (cytosine-5)-methyltransferase 1
MDQSTVRLLTPLECEGLQCFPDGWTAGASEAQRHKQMGYAEAVNAIEAVVRWLAP